MAGEPEAGVVRTSCWGMSSGVVVHARILKRGGPEGARKKGHTAVGRLVVAGGPSPWARGGAGLRRGDLFAGPAGVDGRGKGRWRWSESCGSVKMLDGYRRFGQSEGWSLCPGSSSPGLYQL